MTNSMTAFARKSIQCEWGTAVWELRSVNHRYLDAHFHTPDSVRELEMTLRALCKKHLERGKIDCILQINTTQTPDKLAINQPIAEECISVCEALATQINSPAKISPFDILRWPGVIKKIEADNSGINKTLVALFEETLIELKEGRRREGSRLQLLIEQRLRAIAGEISSVRQKLPLLLETRRQKIIDKFHDMSLNLDKERLEQELVLLAQKADVEEELDRLDTHLIEIDHIFKRQEPIGRRLDFLMQELNREANTLGSKSIGSDTTQSSVELKVLIEQMREQIQNIE
ncbi:MAG: YicC/YloC family endoribonuclease [Porticoccus sp.]